MHSEPNEHRQRSKEDIQREIVVGMFDEWIADVLRTRPHWYCDLIELTGVSTDISPNLRYTVCAERPNANTDALDEKVQRMFQAIFDSFIGGWLAGYEQAYAEAANSLNRMNAKCKQSVCTNREKPNPVLSDRQSPASETESKSLIGRLDSWQKREQTEKIKPADTICARMAACSQKIITENGSAPIDRS